MCVIFMLWMNFFFFFKQKTAYEMRISEWSSDVCSSDLEGKERQEERGRRERDRQPEHDLDQPPESTRGIAEGQGQAGDDDDDHRDDPGNGPLDRLQQGLQWRFPRHVGAGRIRGAGQAK